MLFVACFSGVEGGSETFKAFYSYDGLKGGLSDFFLSAFAGREEDPSLRGFFPPENFEKLLRSSLTYKELTGNENSIRVVLDPRSQKLFDVKRAYNKDVASLSVHTKIARAKSPHLREVYDLSVTSVRITVELCENTISLRKVEITCVRVEFEKLQKSLKE